MKIAQDKIDEIRSVANIVDVISGYVPLRKRGKNYIGLCPFHQEKTPSFTVNSNLQIYKCFGCSAGGNIFSFLMEYKNLSFIESVQEIAEQYGMKLEYEEEVFNKEQDEIEELFDINLSAAKFFSENLFKKTEGESAKIYLEKRRVKLQTQKTFGLGFALDSWDSFLNIAKSKGMDLEKVKQLGLIDVNANGGYYDKFRSRIIFPIFSPNGRVIAFGGRIFKEGEQGAKYLNSPESKVYHKRSALYGLYHAKESIRELDRAILVEGYMDLISLYQNGVKNVVASSGTSLTDEQVKLLSRFTKNIYVLFDADTAGQKAAVRSIEILLKENFEVKVISLPEGEDPDTFINNYGKDEFTEKVKNAASFFEYQVEQLKRAGKLDNVNDQTEAIREIVKNVSLVKDDLRRSLLIKSLAHKFGLREKLIESELEKVVVPKYDRSLKSSASDSESKAITKDEARRIPELELEIIRLLFEGDSEILGLILDEVHDDDFSVEGFRNLSIMVRNEFASNKDVSTSYLIDRIENPKLKDYVEKILLEDDPISKKMWEEYTNEVVVRNNKINFAKDVVKRFHILTIDKSLDQIEKQLNSEKDITVIMELLKEKDQLVKEKATLRRQNETL